MSPRAPADRRRRLDDYDAKEWERVIRINLTAPFLLTQASLPLLRAADHASILFTSDRIGRKGLAYWGAFAAAKLGTEGLMQTLAEELRDSSRIRVNSPPAARRRSSPCSRDGRQRWLRNRVVVLRMLAYAPT